MKGFFPKVFINADKRTLILTFYGLNCYILHYTLFFVILFNLITGLVEYYLDCSNATLGELLKKVN